MVGRDLFGQQDYRPEGRTPPAPLSWYGGKQLCADWIVANLPEHRVYVEPFGGAASVLLRKRPSEVEIYNDLDGRIVNFYKVLRTPGQLEALERALYLTPYSREEFGAVADEPEPSDPVERARWFFVRCRQAIGGLGTAQHIEQSWWSLSTRESRGMSEVIASFLSSIRGLAAVGLRLRTVLFECKPALDLISSLDAPDVLFYCDPPYVPSTRHGGQANHYGIEMTEAEHADLLDLLCQCVGSILISGYACDLYDRRLATWRRSQFDTKAMLANSGEPRAEIMWSKP